MGRCSRDVAMLRVAISTQRVLHAVGYREQAVAKLVDDAGDVHEAARRGAAGVHVAGVAVIAAAAMVAVRALVALVAMVPMRALVPLVATIDRRRVVSPGARTVAVIAMDAVVMVAVARSEEHTSELQSLMRISYAVFCLKKQ